MSTSKKKKKTRHNKKKKWLFDSKQSLIKLYTIQFLMFFFSSIEKKNY